MSGALERSSSDLFLAQPLEQSGAINKAPGILCVLERSGVKIIEAGAEWSRAELSGAEGHGAEGSGAEGSRVGVKQNREQQHLSVLRLGRDRARRPTAPYGPYCLR